MNKWAQMLVLPFTCCVILRGSHHFLEPCLLVRGQGRAMATLRPRLEAQRDESEGSGVMPGTESELSLWYTLLGLSFSSTSLQFSFNV